MIDWYVEENNGESVRKLPSDDWAQSLRNEGFTDRWQLLTVLKSWAQWLREPFGSEKHHLRVSTVFLSLDHQFGYGPPILYETMIFAGDNFEDLYGCRYSTRAQAIVGHEFAVKNAFDLVSRN